MTESKAQLETNLQIEIAPVVSDTQPEKQPEAPVKEPVQDTVDDVVVTVEAAVEEVEPMNSSGLETAERVINNFIEFNESAYKSNEMVSQEIYVNYVSNVNAMFAGMKALSVTTTSAEFYRVAIENNSAAIDRMKDQYLTVSDLAEQAIQETMDASKKAYSGVFPTPA